MNIDRSTVDNQHSNSIAVLLIWLGVAFTVFSYANNSGISSFCDKAMYVAWVLLFGNVVLKRYLQVDRYFWFLIVAYVVLFLECKIMNSYGVYPSSGIGPGKYLPMCALFYLIGMNIAGDKHNIETLLKAFVVCGTCLVLLKFSGLLLGETDQAKNQTGQIVAITIILLVFFITNASSAIASRMSLGFSAVCYVALWLLHCRTSLLAVTIVLLILWIRHEKKAYEYILVAIFVCAVMFYFGSTSAGRAELYALLQGDNSATELTLNSISSGRVNLYKEIYKEICERPLVGYGAWAYIDSFPLHVLRTGGVFSAMILFPLVYGKLFSGIKMARHIRAGIGFIEITNNLRILGSICCFYLVVSLFEGYPPLGPGTSVFFLWIFWGAVAQEIRTGSIEM